jgi:hypothetical protein
MVASEPVYERPLKFVGPLIDLGPGPRAPLDVSWMTSSSGCDASILQYLVRSLMFLGELPLSRAMTSSGTFMVVATKSRSSSRTSERSPASGQAALRDVVCTAGYRWLRRALQVDLVARSHRREPQRCPRHATRHSLSTSPQPEVNINSKEFGASQVLMSSRHEERPRSAAGPASKTVLFPAAIWP